MASRSNRSSATSASKKILPVPHTTSRLFYGARASAGLPLLALELEGTRANDAEDFPASGQSTTTTSDRVKLGLRSSLRLSTLLSLTARGGVQARRDTVVTTTGGVANTVRDADWTYKPYAGLSGRLMLAPKISADLGVTAVFNQFPDMSQNDYQTTLGLVISVP